MYRVVIKYAEGSEEELDSTFSLEEALDIQDEIVNTPLHKQFKEVSSVDIQRVK